MRYLLYFLQKQYIYFLFLALEAISLLLLFNNNEYQNNALTYVSNGFAGSVLNMSSNVSEYFSLRRVNRILAEDNAKLHSNHSEAFYKADTDSFYQNDTLYKLEYRYISAKVINNSTNKRNNFLMLNKGHRQGIENHMGVIMGDRIVGQVVSVSDHFCWVMSLLNKDSRISGKFKKNNQLVNIEWGGGDYQIGDVKEIPKHVVIHKGDTIITSGNSDIFPEGLLIGTIDHFTIAQEENFNYASIRFATDFNSLSFVEVLIDMMRKEKEDLKNSFKSSER
ncbi:MAG TPA: rod shape-determining protein MreC [Bacteroidales bacterium]|nr:rod shape-determining protein MreC [Bacteroidales bacterium]